MNLSLIKFIHTDWSAASTRWRRRSDARRETARSLEKAMEYEKGFYLWEEVIANGQYQLCVWNER
jgi:hypothetical protein